MTIFQLLAVNMMLASAKQTYRNRTGPTEVSYTNFNYVENRAVQIWPRRSFKHCVFAYICIRVSFELYKFAYTLNSRCISAFV